MIPIAAISLSVYVFDLLTKILVRKHLPLGAEIKILPVFSLVHVQNTGIAFGLFQDNNVLFLIAGLAVAIGMGVLAWRLLATDRAGALAIAVVLGGALGNLTDRVWHGRVTDFLDFYWRAHHWPAFNVADSAICVGAAFLVLGELMKGKNAPSSV
jgi:signal peptidase II